MAKIVALYKTPADPDAFDAHYFKKHVPITKKVPWLRKFEVSAGAVNTPAGPSPWHLVAVLSFDSPATLQAALSSAEGQAAVNDLANFAQAGVDLVIFDAKEY